MRGIIFGFILLGLSSFSWAQSSGDMSVFLKSCGYGTLGGAALGAVSLAFVDNPNSKVSNIAKGASLGLYAGIGYGIYQIYTRNHQSNDNYAMNSFGKSKFQEVVSSLQFVPTPWGVNVFGEF